MPIKRNVCEWLVTCVYIAYNLHKSKGISQEELADKVGVSRQAVSKWESEQSTPDLEKIIIMSDFFGVNQFHT